MKRTFCLIFLLLSACGNQTPLPGMDGFAFGDTATMVRQKARESHIAMNLRHLTYPKQLGAETAYVRIVLDKQGRVRAFDGKGIACKQPEAARDVVFKWKAALEAQYGPASNRVMSHPNFTVVNYVWHFSNATLYLGTYMVNFRTVPRFLAILN